MNGADLQAFMVRHGLTRVALAALVDYAPNHVAQMARGERPIRLVFSLALEALDLQLQTKDR